MSSDKPNNNDLTRIEDLGEFLHQEDEETSFEPTSDGPEFGGTDFSPPEESAPTEDSIDFGASAFETSDSQNETEPGQGTGSFSFPQEDTPPEEVETNFESDSIEFTSDIPVEEVPEVSKIEEAAAATEIVDQMFAAEEEETKIDDLFPEPEAESTPIDPPKREMPKPLQEVYKTPEDFDDLKKFAENTSFTGMGAEGNPSFSVLIKNVRYIEDVSDMMTLLKELGLLSDSEEQMRNRLMRGHLLVPRISEFAAIFLAHKLRRFDVDVLVGLSDEIHPPRDSEKPELGLVSKHNLHQNQSHHFHFQNERLDISQIIVSATPGLEGYQVMKYVGVASEHAMIDGAFLNDEDSKEVPRHYQELAQRLKAHALKAHANAVVGLNYQLTPIPSEYGISNSKYRLSCTGNLVWVTKA